MARTALTVPSAYTPDGVKANYDANIAASNDNFEELYGVETQTITTSPAIITMPIVILDYATPGTDKVVMLPAVANTTLRRVNITKVCADTSTATITARTNEYLDGDQNGTLAMTDLGLSVTFQVIDGKWVSDWVGKSAAAPDGQSMMFKPGGTDKHFVFQTDVAAGGKLKIVDTTSGITDEYPSTWIQANRIELGLGSSYVGAVLSGRSDGALVLTSGNDKCHLAADTGENVVLEVDAGQNVQLITGTYEADLSADSSGRLVSASGFSGDGSALTGIVAESLASGVSILEFNETSYANPSWATPSGLYAESNIETLGYFVGDGSLITGIVDSALSSNVPLKNAANAYTNTNTVTVPTGTALIGTSEDYTGVKGIGAQYGVIGEGSELIGVYGLSNSIGVSGLGTISETLLGDLSANTGTNTAWADGDNTKLWWAQKFTAGATAKATAVSLKLAKGSAVAPTLASSTITAYIHADSTGAVGSVLSGGTGTAIRFDALTSTTPAEFYFGGMSASLTQGVSYWIVVKASAFETSAGSIVHDSKSATAGTYGTYNSGTATWDYTAELAAWAKVHSAGGVGVSGTSTINHGVTGSSTVGYGGLFTSTHSDGVRGAATLAGGSGVYGSGYYGVYGTGTEGVFGIGISNGVHGVATTGRGLHARQIGTSSANEVARIERTSASNGTGPILRLNNAGSAAAGNLITGQLNGVDKFTVSVDGAVTAAGGVTANTFPLIQWRGSSASDPTENLSEGQMYWNTSGVLKIYTGSAWVTVGAGP